jgi:uncharacterized membrane protein
MHTWPLTAKACRWLQRRRALSAIASGMLALTGMVFALGFVMVQFSAMGLLPRAWSSG